jgi:cytochrome c553
MRPMRFKSFAFAAALFSTMAVQVSQAQDLKGDVQAGEKKIAMCIGCHGIVGYQASFPVVYKVPMISGQGAKYISNALLAYKSGERRHPTMRSVALGLTPQDIADVSAYYELHGNTLPAPDVIAPAPALSLIHILTLPTKP